MRKVDARKQGRGELFKRRLKVIQLLEDGMPVMKIVEHLGLSWAAVNAAIKKYRAEGESGLRPATRGRRLGTGRALTENQEVNICHCMQRRRPYFYGLKKSLWDREAVKQLIEQKCGIALTGRAIGNYLKRWGLASKNRKRRESDRCSSEIRQWLDLRYAEIEQQAIEEGAEIYWFRKSVMIDADIWCSPNRSQDSMSEASASAAPKKKLSMVSVATNQGKLLWAIINGPFNLDHQIKFVEALIKDSKKNKIFLIRYDSIAYGGSGFMWWVRGNAQRVKVFPETQ